MKPRIIEFGFKDYVVKQRKRIAVCLTCNKTITDGDQTTSNFVRHLRIHRER